MRVTEMLLRDHPNWTPPASDTGPLACPAVVRPGPEPTPVPGPMVETATELSAHQDMCMGVNGRARPSREWGREV